mmetsp:Transcript_41254/g.129619  ORF Transcript_41254/g.129619 Transcript_41254/m.129619 type:complete len:166 (+) Transcript_41254:33-530(+)
MRYRLVATSFGGVGCTSTIRGAVRHTLQTDLPTQMGGGDSAAQPIEALLASLLGCKVATAHYVARHLWARPHNRFESIEFAGVEAVRDPRGALHLPITEPPPSPPGLTRVSGVARVHLPAGSPLTADDVAVLGRVVEQRCPIAAMLAAAGVEMDMEWVPGGAAPL